MSRRYQFFNPKYINKKIPNNSQTIDIKRYIIYYNIYIFINRLQYLAYSYSNIITIIPKYLYNRVLIQYTNKLINLKKSGL